ncbi:MAG TPA: FkbM family methyltransferase [Acidimicrobiales bacterium]|jgi:FkbM family methyltransferase|nr:FkbM family methyltransferase [Acidimicrobiales bacterium]
MGGWLRRRLGATPSSVTVRGGVGEGLAMGTAHSSADYADGTNELPVQEVVRDSLAPGGVFYDVGANVGFFGLIAARIVGRAGAVYAFEPLPHVAAEARANADRNRLANVEVLEVAAGDREGTASLVLTRHPGGATLSEADVGDDAVGRVTVRTVRLDDLVAAGTIRPPDAVKIDVEGVELEVIDGLRRTIAECRPVIVCELDAATRARADEKVRGAAEALSGLGYDVRRLPSSYEGSGWHVVHVVARPA